MDLNVNVNVNLKWLQVLLQHGNICNYSLQQCQHILENEFHYHHHHYPFQFQISDYLLVTVGRKQDSKTKHAMFLRIVKYNNNEALRGSHQLALYYSRQPTNPILVDVDSLSSFRHQILQYTDRLSFERSTFVVIPSQQILIRLKCIRSMLHASSTVEAISAAAVNSYSSLSFRTRTQFIRSMEQLFTSYTRDLHQQYSKEEILLQLHHDIHLFFINQSM